MNIHEGKFKMDLEFWGIFLEVLEIDSRFCDFLKWEKLLSSI